MLITFQGDRGFEGPKGVRGLPGLGIKGDKVEYILKKQTKTITCCC